MTPSSLTLLIVLCAGVTSADPGRCKVINKRNVGLIIYLNVDSSSLSEKLEGVRTPVLIRIQYGTYFTT